MNNSEFSFRETLAERQKQEWNVSCVWLDPDITRIPKEFLVDSEAVALFSWMQSLVDISASKWATMFKPQSAHWEKIRWWKEVLKQLISYIKNSYPDIVVFEDCKRWDIGSTQEKYRDAILQEDWADGMNYSPYMWKDCYTSLLDENNPWSSIVSLCRTSNPEAWAMQHVLMWKNQDISNFEYIAMQADSWAKEASDTDAWLVMWAAHEFSRFGWLKKHAAEFTDFNFLIPKGEPSDFYNDHFKMIRKIVDDRLWFLIPWIWSQTWTREDNIKALKSTIEASFMWPGSIAINSSSWLSEAHLKKRHQWKSFEKAAEEELDFFITEQKRIIN